MPRKRSLIRRSGWSRARTGTALAALCVVLGAATGDPVARAGDDPTIGINVLLKSAITSEILADLESHGRVLDLFPEIHGLTMRASTSELATICGLDYVEGANPDAERSIGSDDDVAVPDFADGGSRWHLDAVNVMDADGSRTVDQDGEGVYIAVLDSGLVSNWRNYFPEDRIATQFAKAFGGGGSASAAISEQPGKWEHDNQGHGMMVTSVILGFAYSGPLDLPGAFNGVAPKATVIPVKLGDNDDAISYRTSVVTRGILYLTSLKTSGALGGAPLVINMSFGGIGLDVLEKAAIDHAIAQGVILVAGAHNHGEAGVRYPAAYAPVVAVANAGWVREIPEDDPTVIEWITRDVPEGDASEFFIAPNSGRAKPGQDLDLSAPGFVIPVPWGGQSHVDYTFTAGTSVACPHVSGTVALMLQKNPDLVQVQVESILEGTTLPLPPGCADVRLYVPGVGDPPVWSDLNLSKGTFLTASVCWGANATGHGLLQTDAAIAGTPAP